MKFIFWLGFTIEMAGVLAFLVGHFLVPEWHQLAVLIPVGGIPALVALSNQ